MSRPIDAHSPHSRRKPGIAAPTRPPPQPVKAAQVRQNKGRKEIRPQKTESAQAARGSDIERSGSSESSHNEDLPPPVPPKSPTRPSISLPTVRRRAPPVAVSPPTALSPARKPAPSSVSPRIVRAEAPGAEAVRKTTPHTVKVEETNLASRLMSQTLHTLSKHRAKRWYNRLVSDMDDLSEPSSKRRRERAGNGLLKMASRGPEGKAIVVRKLLKTPEREEKTVRALLILSDEELESFQSWLWEEVPHSLAGTATDLIELVRSSSPQGHFFRKTLPKVLGDEANGAGAILKLINKHPDFFVHINHELLFRFGKHSLEEAVPLTIWWRRAIKLLLTLLDRLPGAPVEARKKIHLPLLRILLEACTEGFLWVDENTLRRGKVGSQDAVQLLQFIFRVLREVGEDPEALDQIVPSGSPMRRLVGDLMLTFAQDRIHDGNTLNASSLLVMKTLSILLQSRVVRDSVDITVVTRWTGVFVDMVLLPSTFPTSLGKGPSAAELAKIDLKPETAAFNILCGLPEPAFAEALALTLSQCDPQTGALAAPPYTNYHIIGALVGLSSTRRHSRKTSHALIRGGTCEYLARVLSCDNPNGGSEGALWKAKGLAMTCLSNIIERMDREDLRRHISKGLIASV
ncbi:hypothetical protein FS837_008334, partial [Tulasnella sp. UAMH 9824]